MFTFMLMATMLDFIHGKCQWVSKYIWVPSIVGLRLHMAELSQVKSGSKVCRTFLVHIT